METANKATANKAVAKSVSSFLVSAAQNNHDDSDFDQKDFSYGWLRIAQSMTDQRKKGSDTYIEGLQEGDFFNSMSGENYGSEVKVIVLKFFRSYSEYSEDGDKQQFVRSINEDEWKELGLTREGGVYKGFDNGNIGKEQLNYMVYLPDYPGAGILRFALSGASFAPARAWNTLIRAKFVTDEEGNRFIVPKHLQIWKLRASYIKGDQGSWYAIGKGSSFSGDFVSFVSEEDVQSITATMQMVAANESKIMAHEDKSSREESLF